MAQTSYTITDANIGDVLPADGWITDLRQTQAGPYDMPQWSEGKQQWTKGRFVLRGAGDYRDLCCIDTQSGAWASHWAHTAHVWANASIGYRGGLMIVCVPRGSVWELSLSDVPGVRAPPPSLWTLINQKPELEPVLRR